MNGIGLVESIYCDLICVWGGARFHCLLEDSFSKLEGKIGMYLTIISSSVSYHIEDQSLITIVLF